MPSADPEKFVLRSTVTSPFGRKVRIAAEVLGLNARITLVPGTSIASAEGGRTKPADRPLASMLMHIATFDTSTGVTQHLVQVEAVVKAESLVQPLLILAPTRPSAWPL